jgi:hypothetical protein
MVKGTVLSWSRAIFARHCNGRVMGRMAGLWNVYEGWPKLWLTEQGKEAGRQGVGEL